METVENQKIIIISKAQSDKAHPYAIMNREAGVSAMTSLKNTEFKLWFYLNSMNPSQPIALSRADFCRTANCSKNTYITAVNSLIDKGYLVQLESNNKFMFYEEGSASPSEDDIEVSYPKERVDEVEGFIF